MVGLLVVGLPPVMLAGAWPMAGASALEDDLIYYLPQRAFFGAAIRGGELPLWNPHVALGYASAADPQSGTWYPGTYLFALLNPFWAYPLTICLHFALAGWGMYRFLRGMHRCWAAALLGAVAFEFCGFLVAHRVHLTMHHAAAWVPLILWAWGRYARTSHLRHLAVAALCMAAQLLVQHIQVSIMTGALVTAYVAYVGWPRRRRVWPGLVAGMVLAAGLAAVQLLPTAMLLQHTTRSLPLYERFTENSYEWSSLALFLFPYLYGLRTPNFYEHAWWGKSHLCEQAAYASLPVLCLALAALVLWRRDRQIRFWSLAGLGCLALAFGEHNPITPLLFKVPGLDVLRVPARWLLGVNVALVVLAATALDALLVRRDVTDLMKRAISGTVRYGILLVLIGSVALMARARWQHRDDTSAYGEAIASSLSARNPAVLIPIVLMAATAVVLWQLGRKRGSAGPEGSGAEGNRKATREPAPYLFAVLIVLTVVDLASFSAFNDTHQRTYARAAMREQPLAERLKSQADDGKGHRLWIPRERADYRRPLEVLWPMTNMLFGIDTLQAYTPIVRGEQRYLLGFKPWGASETALTLLRNPGLLRALSVRWVAGRSSDERGLLASAGGPDDATAWRSIGISTVPADVEPGPGVIWPVSVDAPGVYGVAFTAEPVDVGAGRWFVVLETEDGERVVPELVFEPVDLPARPRRMRCYFRCQQAVGAARVRVYTYRGRPLQVSAAAFGRAAALDVSTEAYAKRWESPDGVVVYEVTGSRPRAYLVEEVIPAESASEALEWLTSRAFAAGLPNRAVVEEYIESGRAFGRGRVRTVRAMLNRMDLEVQTDEGGFLVVADTFDAGWSARIDGQSVPVYRTNGVVRGVAVPAGASVVTFRYWPPGLTVGSCVSALSLGLVVLALVRRRVRP